MVLVSSCVCVHSKELWRERAPRVFRRGGISAPRHTRYVRRVALCLLDHRQLRDVAICPHEKGIVSYVRSNSIVEHDLIAPNTVRRARRFRRVLAIDNRPSHHGGWLISPSLPTPSPPSISQTQTTLSSQQVVRKPNFICPTSSLPIFQHPPPLVHLAVAPADSDADYGRASITSTMSRSITLSCSHP